jgi:hypothetical protein
MSETKKVLVRRRTFDTVIGGAINLIPNDKMYDYYYGVHEVLEIRKEPQVQTDMGVIYVDFSGDLSGAREFAKMYGVARKEVVLARDWRDLRGRPVKLKPVNLDYPWSLLNWNHDIHVKARELVYLHEALYGSV